MKRRTPRHSHLYDRYVRTIVELKPGTGQRGKRIERKVFACSCGKTITL